METFDLAAYLSNGVENIVKNILRATLKDPRESAFMPEAACSLSRKDKSRQF